MHQLAETTFTGQTYIFDEDTHTHTHKVYQIHKEHPKITANALSFKMFAIL